MMGMVECRIDTVLKEEKNIGYDSDGSSEKRVNNRGRALSLK